MASGVVAPRSQLNGHLNAKAQSDLHSKEVFEYEKIIRLHEEVRAGKHPRLTMPAASTGKLHNLASPNASTASPPCAAAAEAQTQPNNATPVVELDKSSSDKRREMQPTPDKIAAQTPSLPLAFKKSDALVRAEVKLHRERLESILRERCAQKRSGARLKLSKEDCIPAFDLTEAFEKALSLVKPVSVAASSNEHNNNDSIDEASFYSSKDNDSSVSPPERVSDGGGEQGRADDVVRLEPPDRTARWSPGSGEQAQYSQPELSDMPPRSLEAETGTVKLPEALSPALGLSPEARRLAPLHGDGPEYVPETYIGGPVTSGSIHGRRTRSRTALREQGGVERAAHDDRQLDASIQRSHLEAQVAGVNRPRLSPGAPIIRSHNRSPLAPQPTRVSPLAIARIPHVVSGRRSQVESLSRPFSARESPESPDRPVQMLHPSKRRRYAEADGRLDTEPDRRRAYSPEVYIKQEPVSPPPFSATEDRHGRPAQYEQGRREADHDYESHHSLSVQTRGTRALSPRYERVYPDTPGSARFSGTFAHESFDRTHKHRADFHRYASCQASRPPRSPPPTYHLVSPSELRPSRAISRGVLEGPARERVQYYHENHGPYRSQVVQRERSHSLPQERLSPSDRDSVIVSRPSRGQLPRLAIDENGKRYVEAPLSAHDRHSMAPPSYAVVPRERRREPEHYVEHLHVPIRLSDRPYSERTYVEHAPVSPRVTMRRVMDDADRSEPRSYRAREYASRPASLIIPREEYVYAREPPEQRASHFEEVIIPRHYIEPPSAGDRFANARYEVAPPPRRRFESRMPESEPEAPFKPGYHRESLQPQPQPQPAGRRLDVVPPPSTTREYSIRPEDAPPRREYISAPSSHGEPYAYIAEAHPPPHAPAPLTGRRYVDEVRLIESPMERPQEGDGYRRASYRY